MTPGPESPNAEPKHGSRFDSWPLRRKVLLLSLPAVACLVMLFVAGEIAGRLLEKYAGYMPRRRASYLQANPFLRSALVPGITFTSGPIRIEVNSLGFRGGEIAVPKPPGTFRIFAVGESTTFGWKGVTSHREAWPARLEAKLRAAHPDRMIEVINAGVPGYTSVEQRVNFMLRISALEPDALVIYHGNNDINWSWVPDVEIKTIYGREVVTPSTSFDRLVEHSYVYMELRSRIDRLGRENRLKHDDPDPNALRMLKRNLQGLIDDARRMKLKIAIGTFAHALDERGAPDVFSDDERALSVPAVGQWFDELSVQGARRSFPLYNASVRDLAAANGIALAEIAPAIPKTREYFTDWCHFTVKGEEIAAAQWFAAVESADWFGR